MVALVVEGNWPEGDLMSSGLRIWNSNWLSP